MSLSQYKNKRNFSSTPEPDANEKGQHKKLRFVVQKHDASNLHYDFRLEMEGVLKSWAIPKGPSLNPKDKRLAVMVEDHPYSYRNFEGVIPEGNYGGGTVIVWDEGFYEPVEAEDADSKSKEEQLSQQLKAGNLKFTLHGKKLKGQFSLFRLKKGGDDAWLLVKIKDEAVSLTDITLKDASVKSGKTIAELADAHQVPVKNEEKTSSKKIKKSSTNNKENKQVSTNTKRGQHSTKGFKKVGEKNTQTKKPSSIKTKNTSADEVDTNTSDDQELKLNRQTVIITNANKLFWKKEGIVKGDILNYYLNVAPYILPYMVNRPQSLHRYPNGVGGKAFFQKDVAGKVPQWIPTFEDFSESTQEAVHYLVCKNEATLLYMVNLGCIEMHPWHSRVKNPLAPDYCLIDLDPDKSNTYDEIVETALVAKQLMDSANIDAYVKTSGATGMHIYIPLGAKYNFDQSKQLAELIVKGIHKELPKLTSLERSPAKRKGKIYLDDLQNGQTKTAAAPYSLRPKEGAPVSTPLHWSEVKKGLQPAKFNIHNTLDRLKSEGDLFKPVLGKGIQLEKAIEKINSIIS